MILTIILILLALWIGYIFGHMNGHIQGCHETYWGDQEFEGKKTKDKKRQVARYYLDGVKQPIERVKLEIAKRLKYRFPITERESLDLAMYYIHFELRGRLEELQHVGFSVSERENRKEEINKQLIEMGPSYAYL